MAELSIPGLVRLPMELVEQIISELPRSDIFSVRQTCQTLNSFVSPTLFKSIKIALPSHRGVLTTTSRNSLMIIAPFVRSLELLSEYDSSEHYEPVPSFHGADSDCFSPRPESPSESSGTSGDPAEYSSSISRPGFIREFTGPSIPIPMPESQSEFAESSSPSPLVGSTVADPTELPMTQKSPSADGEDELVTALVSFVRQLQNVQSVKWSYHSSRLGDSYVGLASLALAEIASLKEVNWSIYYYRPERLLPDLSRFKDLTSIDITHHLYGGAGIHLLTNVMPAIGRSSMLTNLVLTVGGKGCNNSLDSLVHDSDIWGTTTTLLDLKLTGVPIRLVDPRVRRVFQNLKHLTLGVGEYLNRRRRYRDWQDQNRVMAATAWKEIWDSLYEAGCNEGLWLETLITEGNQPPSGLNALFNYLQSHPELKELSIHRPPHLPFWWKRRQLFEIIYPEYFEPDGSTPGIEEQIEADSTRAARFWCNVLPQLGRSLRLLSITPLRKGPWCYGPEASTAIQQCRLLEKLEIGISAVGREWARAKAASLEITTLPIDESRRLCETSWIAGRCLLDEQEQPQWQKNVLTKPIPWGNMESATVLLAVDLGDSSRLKRVDLYFAEADLFGGCDALMGGSDAVGDPTLWTAQRYLERFVPWEGYPHKLVGDDGIFHMNPYLGCQNMANPTWLWK